MEKTEKRYNERPKYFLAVFCSLEYSKRQNGELLKSLAIIADMQDKIFEKYDFSHTDSNLDWTSLVLYGEKSSLGKFGYSRDHRPDKKQITLGLAELASPINIPIGITINAGNKSDMKHFNDTYGQIKRKLREGSMIVVDKGAGSEANMDRILKDKMKYLTLKKLNKSDDKRIKEFDKTTASLIEKERRIYGVIDNCAI